MKGLVGKNVSQGRRGLLSFKGGGNMSFESGKREWRISHWRREGYFLTGEEGICLSHWGGVEVGTHWVGTFSQRRKELPCVMEMGYFRTRKERSN